MQERQVTREPRGHILTNSNVWSPDGEWIVYDTRSDPEGAVFDGETIEAVRVRTGEVRTLYRARDGARCGAASYHPREAKVAFILGPERPTPDWSYGPWHRQGAIAALDGPGTAANLDARDLAPPFTPGALRGGTHLHIWNAAGDRIAFTYEDHVLATLEPGPDRDSNARNLGVAVPGRPVWVPHGHPRNRDGECFSVVVTRTVASPRPGSDEILRACEEAWIGANGYLRPDGSRQRHALAFQGRVVTEAGTPIDEVFVVDLPENLTVEGDGPLAGTPTRAPYPPRGVAWRRITRTAGRRHPGIGGPRHWLRSAPDGARIAFLMKDDGGIVQLWTVSPNGSPPAQLTRNPQPIASAFTWSPDGRRIAHVLDGSVCATDVSTGATDRLMPRAAGDGAPRPEACVFSPDGRRIACVKRASAAGGTFNQVFVIEAP